MSAPRFIVGSAEWCYPATAATVYDGFTPLDTFASSSVAQEYADYLNKREAEKAAA